MEHKTAVRVGALVLSLAMALPAAAAAVDADALLRQAETVRRKDPEAFAETLAELERVKDSASATQRRHLRLLQTYQLVLTGKYDAAVQQALVLHKEAKELPLKFRSALLIANSAAIVRDFSLGLRYLEIALGLSDQIEDLELRHQAYLVAAVLYNQYGQFALGKHYAERVLEQPASPASRCIANQTKAEALLGMGTPLLDESGVASAISECVALQDVITSNLLRTYLARRWSAQGEAKRSIQLLETHLPEVESTRYPRLIGEARGLLAEYRLMLGDTAGAERDARAALSEAGNGAYSLPLVTAHKVLYEIALRRNDQAAALGHYRRYAEADKARLDEIKAREFAFQLSRHELQQKNQAIELLQKQNEVLKLQQEISKASARNTQLLLLLLAMVLAAIGMWAYKVKRVQVAFRRAAEVDGLTGLSNRRHFRQNAEALLQRCAGTGREASLVLLDLDHFKHINDRHGHAVGDWVLQQVAVAIQAACREGDVCGRLGGEEFAILSCGSDIEAARRIAQRCSEHLAAIDTSVIGRPVTASFGCTTSARSGYAFESMFAHADAAMYQAKAGGRDRVRAYGEGGVGPATVLELVRS